MLVNHRPYRPHRPDTIKSAS